MLEDAGWKILETQTSRSSTSSTGPVARPKLDTSRLRIRSFSNCSRQQLLSPCVLQVSEGPKTSGVPGCQAEVAPLMMVGGWALWAGRAWGVQHPTAPGPRAQVQIELHRAQVSRQPVGAVQAG